MKTIKSIFVLFCICLAIIGCKIKDGFKPEDDGFYHAEIRRCKYADGVIDNESVMLFFNDSINIVFKNDKNFSIPVLNKLMEFDSITRVPCQITIKDGKIIELTFQ